MGGGSHILPAFGKARIAAPGPSYEYANAVRDVTLGGLRP
jgi:hypothetical protein